MAKCSPRCKAFIIAGSLIVVILFLIAVKDYAYSKSRIYEVNWDIQMPSSFIEEYAVSSPVSFHGDGRRYSVFNAVGINSAYIEFFEKTADSNVESFVDSVMTELCIPKDKEPSWETYYLWREYKKDGNCTLVILFYPKTGKLYFVEELMRILLEHIEGVSKDCLMK